MQRGHLDDMLAFMAVGQERSFTKAAAKLGVSQSALSHTIRQLESRLGVRLLTRTTRSVSPTEAGERLLRSIAPHLKEIEAEIKAVTELREKPAGTIRITATEHAADAILLPKLAKLLPKYPDIKVEIVLDLRQKPGYRRSGHHDAGGTKRRTGHQRTQSRCVSGRTCAWRSWGRHRASGDGLVEDAAGFDSTDASHYVCPAADCMLGSLKRAARN